MDPYGGYVDTSTFDWSTYDSLPIWSGAPSYGGGSSSNGSFWNAFSAGLNDATKILGSRYAVPQLNPGQVIQTGPNGQTFMSQAANGGALITNGAIGGVNTSTLLLLGGAALVAMMVMGKH